MYSKSVRPIFLWKNGRADDRKSRLFGALRIVLGLHLSICGVVDLPIIGSNLVKTGVQDAIFDRFWWSFIWNAKVGRFVHVAPKYVFLSATPQLLCDIAKITNFLLFCKKIPYYMELEGIKNKKFRYYFNKVGQIRTNTDEHRFFSLIFAPSELKDAAGSFPYWHPRITHASLTILGEM